MLYAKTKDKIRKELPNRKILTRCACDFSILGDLTRMKICYLFCNYKEFSVSEISDLVGVSVSAVSHSLKALKKCRCVKSRRDFRNVYYRLDDGSAISGLVRKLLIK